MMMIARKTDKREKDQKKDQQISKFILLTFVLFLFFGCL